jgi:hypothetical protein
MTLICTGLVPDSSSGRLAVRIVIGRVWCPGRVVWLPEGVPLRTRRLSLEVSHQLDVPTLHTIGMLRRAKLPIRLRMLLRLSR